MRDLTQLVVSVAKQSHLIEQALSEETDLPVSQIRLLLEMNEHSVNLQQLKDILALDISTLSRQLAPLVKHGEVAVLTTNDKRQRQYRLTDTGLAHHQQLWHRLEQLQASWTEDWSTTDIESLAKLLQRLLKNMKTSDI